MQFHFNIFNWVDCLLSVCYYWLAHCVYFCNNLFSFIAQFWRIILYHILRLHLVGTLVHGIELWVLVSWMLCLLSWDKFWRIRLHDRSKETHEVFQIGIHCIPWLQVRNLYFIIATQILFLFDDPFVKLLIDEQLRSLVWERGNNHKLYLERVSRCRTCLHIPFNDEHVCRHGNLRW